MKFITFHQISCLIFGISALVRNCDSPFSLFLPGMFRRITAAASRLLKGEGGGGQTGTEAGLFYPLEGLNSMVQCLITTHPSLVLLWCQVLLIIDYTNYSWWAEVHQTPR